MTAIELVRAEFLRDICLNPDDDMPRLIFADWLEDHGEPDRAEFIRFGCAHPECEQKSPQAIYWITVQAKWRRGFVASISLTLADFMIHAAVLFREHPITEVTLTNIGVEAWIVEGSLRYSLFAGGGSAIAGLPLPVLNSLSRHGHAVVNDVVAELSASLVTHGRSLAGLPPLRYGTV